MSIPDHVGTPEWLTLERDERVLVRASPSKNLLLLTFIAGTVLFLALGVVGILFTVDIDTARTVTLVLLLLLFAVTAGVYLLTGYREYAVTSHRVCTASGLGSKDVTTVDADAVRAVIVEQAGWQSLVNVGDLRFDVDGGQAVRFTAIEEPDRVHERVLAAVEAAGSSGA
jgi:uncharacterized membrane protein YdbT with pleckstrin-like domain